MGSGGSCWCCQKFIEPWTMENYMSILICEECLAKMKAEQEEAIKEMQREENRQRKMRDRLHGIKQNREFKSKNFKKGLSRYVAKSRGIYKTQ